MAPIQGIKKLPISIKTDQAAEIFMKLANVSSEISRLDEKFKHSILRSDLINTLALKESVQSTRIEGTQVTFTDMVNESHKSEQKKEHIEVLNYRRALYLGQERIRNGYPLTTRLILDLHNVLMEGARGANSVRGEFRKVPNWIGPTKRFEDAVYLPVSASKIENYLINWETFANKHPYGEKMDTSHLNGGEFILDENIHPLLKVAILHAQFESIHPFLDGNGRLGRIIIALYMMQSAQLSSPIFFVSEELAKQRAKYYHLLNETRGKNPKWYNWLNFFLDASQRMAEKLNVLLDQSEQIAGAGLQKCEGHTERQVYLLTFRYPNITAVQAAEHARVSSTTARRTLNTLAEKELLFKDPAQKRNVEYFNYDVLDLFDR
ncbi:Fic family protein [Niallia sp. NCCP-28]|uniref:Fic family protein n=1 Tax=Niallia sp. NCCP-28 TaxID=2934712 RepID=UPI00208C56D0|nr:Fic family protein [Niallia sp. NCCP-28]GKU84914.1 cell division protein Fic [Niallia sp. NCCP-28]